MKKLAVALAAYAVTNLVSAAESAGLTGIVNASGTVEVRNFVNPKDIWTVYSANDPSESAVIVAYVGYKKVGQHQLSLEWTDRKGNRVDRCDFDPATASSLPHIHTITCKWGGRLPEGGLTFSVYNKFGGKTEKIGELFLPSKSTQ